MGRKNDSIWCERFRAFLKLLQQTFLLDLGVFRAQYHVSEAATSYWASGRNLPSLERFNDLHHFIEESVASTSTPHAVIKRVSIDFYEFAGTEGYEWLCSARLNAKEFVTSALNYYFFLARGEMPEALGRCTVITPTGKTRAVLFDFSGTLVTDPYTDSTWFTIWHSLGLDAGRYDIMANGVDVTPERQEAYDFSIPYAYNRTAVITRTDSTIDSMDDLAGKTTANTISSTYAEVAESYGAKVTGVDDLNQTFELLKSGRIDATLNAEVTYYDYMKAHPESGFRIAVLADNPTEVAIPMRKGAETETLRTAINEILAELSESGELSALSEQFFGTDISKGA